MAKTFFRSLVAMLVIVPGAVLLQQLRPPEQRVLEGATPAPARFTKSHFRLFREDALRAIRDFNRATNQ